MKEKSFEFYVEKCNVISSYEQADVSFLPPIVRRRLSKLDKCALSVMNSVCAQDIQNIVFCSQYGEVERLKKIIAQYSEAGEVSPNTFAGSVHNFPVGFFLLNTHKAVPYTAISSHDRSISSGLLTSVIAPYGKTLLCYAEETPEENYRALALRLCKTPSPAALKYKMTMSSASGKDVFEQYAEFFCKNSGLIRTPLFTLESAG